MECIQFENSHDLKPMSLLAIVMGQVYFYLKLKFLLHLRLPLPFICILKL